MIGFAIVVFMLGFYLSNIKDKPEAREVFTYNGLLHGTPKVYSGYQVAAYQKVIDGFIFEERIYKTSGSPVNTYRVVEFNEWSGRAYHLAWIEHSSGLNIPIFNKPISYAKGVFRYSDRFKIPEGIPLGAYKLKGRITIHYSVLSSYTLKLSDIEFEIK